jgi:WD40 repeat protein/serine/threonine protein kinase
MNVPEEWAPERPAEPGPGRSPRSLGPSEPPSETGPLDLSGADDDFGLASHAPGSDTERPGLLPTGARVGGVTVLRLLAEGGIGQVYVARQHGPDREVALKVLRSGPGSASLSRRFAVEADLLARLKHPRIAQVHAAGLHPDGDGGLPYIVMELVAPADTITRFADAAGLSIRDRVALVLTVCDAVAHAHRQGIVHRDLKPGNILVDADGEPKVIDFGVARSLLPEDERLTTAAERGELLGTVRYMSPEQLGLDDGEVDTRSDVYALGLVLHELLLGDLPYDLRGRNLMEAACILADRDSLPIGSLARRLRGQGAPGPEAAALGAIMATCLEPRRGDRYATAGDLRDDLARWLAGRPVHAHPPSLGESLRRLGRRHRVAAITSAAVLATLLAAVAGISWFWLQAERQRATADHARAAAERAGEVAQEARAAAERRGREAEVRAAEARRQLYLSTVLLAAEARDRDNLGEARRLLAEAVPLAAAAGGEPIELACLAASLDEATAVCPGDGDTVSAVCWGPDGRTVAIGTMAGRLHSWRPADGAITDLSPHEAAVWELAFSPDGRWLASASADGSVRIHRVAAADLDAVLDAHRSPVYGVAFSADGGRLATASKDRTIRLWRTGSWEEDALFRGHEGTVYSVEFSEDGQRLVSAGQDGTARLWDTTEGSEVLRIAAGSERIFRADISADGRLIATAGEDGTARVWDAADGTAVCVLEHPLRVNAVAFLAGDERLATASGDGLLRVWDIPAGRLVDQRRGHAAGIWDIDVASSGDRLASGSADGTTRTWDLSLGGGPALAIGPRLQAVAASSDGSALAVGTAGGQVHLIDAASLRPERLLAAGGGRINAVAFDPRNDVLAAGCDDGQVRRWRLPAGDPLPPFPLHRRRVYAVGYSSEGDRLVTAGEDGTARLVAADDGEELLSPLRHPRRVFAAAIDPAGLRLATGCGDRLVRIWHAEDGRLLHVCKGHEGPVNWVTFAPAGRRLASASSDGSIRIWDAGSGAVEAVLTGPARQVWKVAFSPAGSRVAGSVADGTIHLWDTATGRPVAILRGHRDEVWGLGFLPDREAIASVSWDGTLRLWGVSAASLARARAANQAEPTGTAEPPGR